MVCDTFQLYIHGRCKPTSRTIRLSEWCTSSPARKKPTRVTLPGELIQINGHSRNRLMGGTYSIYKAYFLGNIPTKYGQKYGTVAA